MGACCGKKKEKNDDEESIYDANGVFIGRIKKESINNNNRQNSQSNQQTYLNPQNTQPQPQSRNQQQSYNKGKGVQIGGNQQQPELSQNELLAKAAEERLQKQQNRGLTQKAQVDLEFKLQKQKEVERLQMEKGQGGMALRWNQ